MPSTDPPTIHTWTQQSLLQEAPDVIEVTIRLGFIPGSHHARWMVETHNAVTGDLLAMTSQLGCEFWCPADVLAIATQRALAHAEEFVSPFA